MPSYSDTQSPGMMRDQTKCVTLLNSLPNFFKLSPEVWVTSKNVSSWLASITANTVLSQLMLSMLGLGMRFTLWISPRSGSENNSVTPDFYAMTTISEVTVIAFISSPALCSSLSGLFQVVKSYGSFGFGPSLRQKGRGGGKRPFCSRVSARLHTHKKLQR